MKVTTITLDFATGPSATATNVDAELVNGFVVLTDVVGIRTAYSIQNLRKATWTPAPVPPAPKPLPGDGN